MDVSDLQNTNWFSPLMNDVAQALDQRDTRLDDHRPALEQELRGLQEQVNGWSQTLATPNLSPELRAEILSYWEQAVVRRKKIESQLTDEQKNEEHTAEILDPHQVIDRLNRLDEVLASANPTLGNLELSLHIDRIDCFMDGRVAMRTCKLGIMPDCIPLLVKDAGHKVDSQGQEITPRVKARRRARLRIDGLVDDCEDFKAAAYAAANPDRFANLPDDWFWLDEFRMPDSTPCWAEDNAEAVFMRRQESRLSHAQLAVEFGVTRPTIRAAIRRYEQTHPGAEDQVYLQRGGKRRPKFNLASFADEARSLWLEGWSMEKLAKKFGCSAPTIEKALAHAYRQDGQAMPTRQEIQQAKAAEARGLLESGRSLAQVAVTMKVSDVTIRRYLRISYANEGKPMPDLRHGKRAAS